MVNHENNTKKLLKAKAVKRIVIQVLIYLPLLIWAFITLFPFVNILILATKTPFQAIYRLNDLSIGPDWVDNLKGNYGAIMWQVPFWKNLANSLYIAGMSTLLTLLCASLGGYGFAAYKFKGKELLFGIMLVTLMIPPVVGFIPYFAMMKVLNWFNKARALYLPAIASAYGVFLMRKYIESSVPKDLLDAAKIDGSSDLSTYFRVVLPLITPGLGALGIITFLSSWGSYLLPMLLMQDSQAWTIPLVLNRLLSPTGGALALVITVFPLALIFLGLSKWIISGITAGSTTDF